MVIGDNYLIGSMPTLQPSRLLAPDEESSEESSGGKFDELFNTVFTASNDASKALSAESRAGAAEIVLGELEDLPEHLVASEKSSIAFELNLNVRNKVLDAYSEIMKTQI